jgi:hypothetical protein
MATTNKRELLGKTGIGIMAVSMKMIKNRMA